MQNAFCQQSLELDQTIQIGQATSKAICKEKFVLQLQWIASLGKNLGNSITEILRE